MPSLARLPEAYSAKELRALARRSKDVSQSRRLLLLAAVRDGMDRGSAAKMVAWIARRCGLGPSLQRLGSGGPDRQLDGGSQPACRRSNWLSSRRSSRLARTVRRTGSCVAADRP